MSSGEIATHSSTEVFGPSYDIDHRLDADQLRADLYDTVLRPYEDDELLKQRLRAQSRILRQNPEVLPFIKEAIVEDDGEGTLIAVADLLAESFDPQRTAKQPATSTLLSFLTLANTISLFGGADLSDRANCISQLLSVKLSNQISDESVAEFLLSGAFLDHRMRHAEAATPYPDIYDIDYRYLRVKLRFFMGHLKNRAFAQAYADAMPDDNTTLIETEKIEGDSKQVGQVFSEMRANQQYGIKLGYKPHRLGGSLIFSRPIFTDESDINRLKTQSKVHPLSYRTEAVAEIVHSNQRSFKSLKPKEEEIEEKAIGINYDNLGLIAQYFISPNGELYADRYLQHSLLEIFVNRNKYHAYRELQADVLAGYFDMTRPAELVDRITRKLPSSGPQPVTVNINPMDAFSRLVIPRVRPQAHNFDMREIDAEDNHTSRSFKYHGVVWHRRRLPEGWSASPQAREMAEAIGIALKDNETFVREHHRGTKKLGEIVGHQLLDRQ